MNDLDDDPYNDPGSGEPQQNNDGQDEPVQGLPNRPGEDPAPANGDALFHYDTYWLQYIRTLLDTTIPTLRAHLNGYNTFLNTLSFTTFFGGIALGTYLKTSELSIYIWVIVPIIILQLAKYFLKVYIGAPTVGSIDDLRDPVQIHEAFNGFVTQMQEKLKIGGAIVGFATCAYLFCIPIAIYEYNKKQAPDFNNYTYISSDSDRIIVRGQLPDAKLATLIITGADPESKAAKTLSTNILLDEHDKINTDLLLANLKIVPETIRLEYIQDGHIQSYTYKSFKANTQAAAASSAAKEDPYTVDQDSGLINATKKDSVETKRDDTVKR